MVRVTLWLLWQWVENGAPWIKGVLILALLLSFGWAWLQIGSLVILSFLKS